MFRENALNENDSGWRFFAGDEEPEYLQSENNFGSLDLNLICNYSPDAIPFLDMPVGTFIIRNDDGELKVAENRNDDGTVG